LLLIINSVGPPADRGHAAANCAQKKRPLEADVFIDERNADKYAADLFEINAALDQSAI
jgi:hypothetical protein